MRERVSSDFPKMGTGLPLLDASLQGLPDPDVRPTRTLHRDPSGRFKANRASAEVGPLGPAGGIGPGGIDVTTGRWIPGVRNHAVLQDPMSFERVHYVNEHTPIGVPQ